MTTNNKNGFEIRLEVLRMAKEMVDRQYDEATNIYFTSIEAMAKHWNRSIESLIEQTRELKPIAPTVEEINRKAKDLYSFVVNKD